MLAPALAERLGERRVEREGGHREATSSSSGRSSETFEEGMGVQRSEGPP